MTNMRRSTNRPRTSLILAGILLFIAIIIIGLGWWRWTRPPKPFAAVITLAAAGPVETPVKNHYEPFGVAADNDGNIFIAESVSGRIYRVSAAGYASSSTSQNNELIADGLETPSAIAIDDDDYLIVANTGAHTVVRVDPESAKLEVIAGATGYGGHADGAAKSSLFNGPMGVAVADNGSIYVADTYNDRIRVISTTGEVKTVAGGTDAGYADGAGADALFDTPCGIAVAKDGALLVADTGNRLIRRVDLNGNVTTLPFDVEFDQPVAIAVRDSRSFFVADSGGSKIWLCEFGEKLSATALTGGFPSGLADDELSKARLNRPAGMAILPDGELAFADSGNGLVRALIPSGSAIGRKADPNKSIIQAAEVRALLEPRWPFDPPQARRDIAGTLGEVRGERLPFHDAWFHNGLDIPGAYGEEVRAVHSERVTLPLAVEGAGDTRERIRLPLFGYIHLRIGRDQNDRPIGDFPSGAITFRRNELGEVTGVRVRRGTRINAGDVIGTLNRLHHVHLIAGPSAFEYNALAVLKLPGLIDTVSPVIESVMIADERNGLIFDSSKNLKNPVQILQSPNVKLRVIVRAYDQIDGNPRYRKLGAYRLGYQILNPDGSPAADFREPRYNIVFDRLPADPMAANLAYAEGSQSGYQGATIFDYLATNIVRNGEAREDSLDPAKLAPGTYTMRVFAEDFFGNQTRRDLKIEIIR